MYHLFDLLEHDAFPLPYYGAMFYYSPRENGYASHASPQRCTTKKLGSSNGTEPPHVVPVV